MKKRMTALLLSACMCAGLAGCGTNTPGNNPGHTKTDSSVTSLTDNITVTSVKSDITSFDQLKNGINEFSMNMYSALPADENIFYSPYSISSALSMLDVGANGATKKELENALGITDLDEWNAEINNKESLWWTAARCARHHFFIILYSLFFNPLILSRTRGSHPAFSRRGRPSSPQSRQ